MAGETTSISGLTAATMPFYGGPMANAAVMTAAYATGELEANDVKNIGYVPAGVTVFGFFVKATDMDTGASPALAQKITLGSTDLVTGITAGQSGGQAVYACTPTTTTATTLVSVTNTAASATAAAGTLYVIPLYFG